MLVFCSLVSLVRNSVVLAVYLLFSVACFFTVHEHYFEASRILTSIENDFGSISNVTFTKVSDIEYRAVIDFDEGDYTFEISGTDMGDHKAVVDYSGGNERVFYVDKTKPLVIENFTEFTDSTTESTFNQDKTVSISITEHNFDSELVNLRIFWKAAGLEHDGAALEDITAQMIGDRIWISEGDVHSISFAISEDAVYQIEIAPTDLAGNEADFSSTTVFEIDKTVPVVSARNGRYVDAGDVAFLDIYTYERKDDPIPTIEFSDLITKG